MDVVTCALAAVQTVTAVATLTLQLLNHNGSNNSGHATRRDAREAVNELMRWLSKFHAFLADKQRDNDSSRVSQDFVNQIRDITFDIEDAFDEFTFNVPHHNHTTTTHRLAHEWKYHVRSELRKLCSCRDNIRNRIQKQNELERLLNQVRPGREASSSSQETSLTHNIVEEEEMVDFLSGHRDWLVNQLKNIDQQRATILVVGPGGSGKTFLAKNVYQDEQVQNKFDCHAWIHVSQSYNVEKLKENMFKQLSPRKSTEHTSLDDKRYLVVLDEVWRKEDFNAFANALPRKSKGSIIIVTTQKPDVAGTDQFNIHRMDKLHQEEAWNLFCMKAFRDRNGVCPDELQSSSLEILKRCEGLPLAIALVGSLLSKKQPVLNEWNRFCKSLDFGTNLSVMRRILQPSFEDLQDNHKSCLLYLSLFPKGYSIKRGRLTRSWIAEGFVKKIGGQTLEDVAETYLNILIERHLVQVSELEIDGQVRSCRVSNPIHEILVSMSRGGSFSKVLEFNDDDTDSSERVRRLSVQNGITKFRCNKNWREVRSCFIFGQQDDEDSSSSSRRSLMDRTVRRFSSSGTAGNSLETVIKDFKLLKVLDMQDTPLKDFSKNVGRLVPLRCLNLSYTQVQEVPRSIENLVFLETLNLKHTRVTNLPKGIYELHRLRHLLVSYRDDGEEQGVEVSKRIRSLSSLQELSLVKVNKSRTIKDMGHLTQLRKLRLVGLTKELAEELCESIQKMKGLRTLDVRAKTEKDYVYSDCKMEKPPEEIHRLYLKGRLDLLPRFINSKLQNLVKVGLKGSKLPANAMPVQPFEALPSLMELEMIEYYMGEELVFRAGKFKSLKILHIEEFVELSKVVMERGSMPKLEKLTICKCKNLKSVSPDIFYRKPPLEFSFDEMNEEFISNLQRGKKGKNIDEQGLEPGIGSSQYHQ